jgi:hypothetical protein
LAKPLSERAQRQIEVDSQALRKVDDEIKGRIVGHAI